MENKNKRDINAELKADFPNEAYQKDLSRGAGSALTSIKAQYISERLNDVFGVFGWKFTGTSEVIEGQGVLIHGELTISSGDLNRTIENFGFADFFQSYKDKKTQEWKKRPKNLGDVYKSAMTDSLGKCASIIGIGDSVFKGNVTVTDSGVYMSSPNDLSTYIRKAGKLKGQPLSTMSQKDITSMLIYCEGLDSIKGPLLEDYKAMKKYSEQLKGE